MTEFISYKKKMGKKEAFAKDVSFIAVSKYSGIVVSIIISMVLARLLTPSDFGVVAIATVFIVFFSLFTDMGLGSAVIQRRDLTAEDLKDISGWTFWIGLLLGTLFFFAAKPISRFYNQDILIPICRLLSLQLLFSSFNIVPNALLSKDKKFKIIAVRNITIQIGCGIIAIISAYFGLGLYSLLVNPLLGGFLLFFVNEYCMRQKFHIFFPSPKPLKKIFSYSIYQFLSQIVNYFGNNISSLIIGKTISVSALGYYQKASQTIGVPASAINGVISPVLFPYMSEMQTDLPRMYNAYKRINKILLTLSFPITVLLCICAKEIILIFYGVQWVAAVTCFAIMSFTVATQISSVSIGAVFQACGHTDYLFRVGLINTLIAIACLMFGAIALKSIEAVALMGTISSTWSAAFSIYIVYKKCFNESSSGYFKYALRPLIYYFVCVLAGLLFDKYCDFNIFVSFSIKIIFWIATLYLYLRLFTEYDPVYYSKLLILKVRKK